MFSILFISCLFIKNVISISRPENVKLIIDTDGVYDDIRALSIAITHPNAEVIAITTVHGGVTANQSAANVARLLRLLGKESIPLYVGSPDSLIPKGPVEVWEDLFGSDGIGGVPNANPKVLASDFTMARSQHAVDAMIELTKNTENIVLVGLGPLTNIASAIRKDPGITKIIKKVVLMGGNYLGVGNSLFNSTAEFNFLMDPEAAHIVLSSLHNVIVPWDTCFLKGPEYNEQVDYEESLKQNTELSYFLSNITAKGRAYNKLVGQIYAFVDDVAVAIAIEPMNALQCLELCASVELNRNASTRGQVTVDWLSTKYDWKDLVFKSTVDKNDANWLTQKFVSEYDVNRVNRMLMNAVNPSRNLIELEGNTLFEIN